MNADSETANPVLIDRGLWIDSTARTDREFFRPRLIRQSAPWTKGPQKEHLENSTEQKERPEEIDQEIEGLFEIAKEQIFEDGIESEFSRGLISIIKEYGNDAMIVIANLIVTDQVNAEVASEALRWLGHIDHPKTYRYRLWVLERSLYCSSVRIRDGAVLGLSFLNDPHAISYLKRAIERETCKELRRDMEQVLAHLENTQQCRSS
jgi:hypothetical protein